MLSLKLPFRQRRSPNPVDVMFDHWSENMARSRKEPPTISQLHLMALLFMRF